MNSLAFAICWCVVQVTAVSLLSAGAYLLLKRFAPRTRGLVPLTSLVSVVLLTLFLLSPWPRWEGTHFLSNQLSAICSQLSALRVQQEESLPAVVQHDSVGSKHPVNNVEAIEGRPEVAAASDVVSTHHQNDPEPVEHSLVANDPTDAGYSPAIEEIASSEDSNLVAEPPTIEESSVAVEDSSLSSPLSGSGAGGEGVVPQDAEHSDFNIEETSVGVLTSQVRLEDAPARWPLVVFALFGASLAVGFVRLLIGLAFVRAQRRSALPIEEPALLDLVDILCDQVGGTRWVDVRESPQLSTAATIGWRRPVILLPSDWRNWSNDERRAVLAHEIAHIKHRDFPAWLAAQFGVSLHFYHPLVHWLVSRLRLEQELAADALAAPLAGGRTIYLNTLAAMTLRQADRPVYWPARPFLPTRGTLLRRIEMLKSTRELPSIVSRPVRIAVILLVLCAGLAAAGLRPGGDPLSAVSDQPDADMSMSSDHDTTVASGERQSPVEEASDAFAEGPAEPKAGDASGNNASTESHPGSGRDQAVEKLLSNLDGLKSLKTSDGIEDFKPATPEDEEYVKQTRENFEKIAAAVRKYKAVQGDLPPVLRKKPDMPPYSWRVAILPLLEGTDGLELYEQYKFDEPWDGPNNKKLLEKMPAVYRSPLDQSSSNTASYFAITGPLMENRQTKSELVFGLQRTDDDDGQSRLSSGFGGLLSEKPSNIMKKNRGKDDGSSPTIPTLILIEAKRSTPWTKPNEVHFDPEGPIEQLKGYHEQALPILRGSGTIRFLPRSLDRAEIIRVLTSTNPDHILTFDVHVPAFDVHVPESEPKADQRPGKRSRKRDDNDGRPDPKRPNTDNGAAKVEPVTDATYAAEVEKSPVPVLLHLGATWNGPDRTIAPILDQLASEMGNRVRFRKLDIDENRETVSKFHVTSIPTLLILNRGQETGRSVGVQSKKRIYDWIEQALKSPANAASGPQPHQVDVTTVAPAPKGETPERSVKGAPEQTNSNVATGTFKGRVVFEGKPPVLPPLIKAGGVPAFAADVPDERLVIGKDNGVANVFVYLAEAPEGLTFDHPDALKPVDFESTGGRFSPHAVIMNAGGGVMIGSKGPNTESFHTFPRRNKAFNSTLDSKTLKLELPLYTRPEAEPIEVKSDFHAWMIAYHLPLDHPFGAVTNADGKFEIDGLPPGSYKFQVWHEACDGRFLAKGLAVEIKAGETTQLDIPYPEKKFAQANSQPELSDEKAVASEPKSEVATGAFKGRVVFEGKPPVLPPLFKAGDTNVRNSAFVATQDMPDERLLIGKDNGVANVFVYLSELPPEMPPQLWEPKRLPLESKQGRFVPHALVMHIGEPISVQNPDPIVANVHTYPRRNPGFNMVLRPRDLSGVELVYKQSESEPIEVKSDLYPWMVAYHLPLDHRFGAVTNADGKFEIDGLPPGSYKFQVWHEACEGRVLMKNLAVEIKAGETTQLDIPYPEKKLVLADSGSGRTGKIMFGRGVKSDAGVTGEIVLDPGKNPPPTVEDNKTKEDAKDTKSGTFQGFVIYDKTPPELPPLVKKGATNIRDAAVVAAQDVPNERLVTGNRKGLANVFIYMEKAPEGWDKSHGGDFKRFQFQVSARGRFDPHALLARTGQPVRIANADPMAGNVHTFPMRNKPLNQTIAPSDLNGVEFVYHMPEPSPVQVKSDLHSWMTAYHLPLDHPFAAVTGKDGSFRIHGLPPGTHKFNVWHEACAGHFLFKGMDVVIKAGETATMVIPFPTEKLSLTDSEPKRAGGDLIGLKVLSDSGIEGTIVLEPMNAAPAAEPTAEEIQQQQLNETSRKKLRRVLLALHRYHDVHGHFPSSQIIGPDGKTPHSWRVAILPYLSQGLDPNSKDTYEELYHQYKLDEPWDGPHNRNLLPRMPVFYFGFKSEANSVMTSYFVPVGTGTICNPFNGTKIDEIQDGPQNTIMLIESKIEVPWTKPEDIVFDPSQPSPQLGGIFEKGFRVVTVDGSAYFLPNDFEKKHLLALVTHAGGEHAEWPTAPEDNSHNEDPLVHGIRVQMRINQALVQDSKAQETTEPAPAIKFDDPEVGRGRNNLKKMLLAMHNYHDMHGHFPPAIVMGPDGKTPHSWRVAILPYFDTSDRHENYKELYDAYKFDEPWDGPNNKKLLEKMPDVFRAPGNDSKSTTTSYFAIVSHYWPNIAKLHEAAQNAENRSRLPGDIDPRSLAVTIFDGPKGMRMHDITDGTSNTIMLVESKLFRQIEIRVPWTQPDDVIYDASQPLPAVGGIHKEGYFAGFADGSVHWIPSGTDEKTQRALFTRTGGEVVKRPE